MQLLDRYSNNKTTLIAINLCRQIDVNTIKVLAYTQVQRGRLTNTAAYFVH